MHFFESTAFCSFLVCYTSLTSGLIITKCTKFTFKVKKIKSRILNDYIKIGTGKLNSLRYLTQYKCVIKMYCKIYNYGLRLSFLLQSVSIILVLTY